MTAYQQQMYGPSRAGRARGACSIHAPVAVYDGQGGRHVPFVGSAKSMRAGTARCLTSLNWLGAVATNPSLFHSRIALRVSSTGLSDRQRAGVNPLCYRLSAAFIPLRVLGRSRQFCLQQNSPRQSSNLLEGHVSNVPFRVAFQSSEHDSGKVVNVQQVVGEIRNV
jgi:hypothetical protein